VSKLELAFGTGGISVVASTHPNKMKFSGVLVRLDEPSDKPPSGSNGHKILVTTELAKARLNSIKGMGLNYAPSLDGHAQRRKVGVIQKAWIDGRNLHVEGTIWKHDFPEAEKDLKQAGLGMSMEIGDVEVEDQHASVWKLSDFQFLGATILFRNAAAYHKTLAIAASKERDKQMAQVAKKKVAAGAKEQTGLSKQDVALIAAEAAKIIVMPLAKAIQRQTTVLASFSTKLEEMELDRIAAGTAVDEDVDAADMSEMTEPPMKAAENEKEHHESDGGDDDDDDEDGDEEDMESAVDKGGLEEMGPDLEESEEGDDPGDFNKGTKNHGSQTEPDDKVGKDEHKAVLGSAYNSLKKRFAAMAGQFNDLKAENKRLKKKVGQIQSQVIKASSEIGRRSVSADISSLLRKHNYDSSEIFASGQPLTVEAVDAMLANQPGLSTVERMTLKNKMLQAGAMEQGVRQ
jgi:hypothetical protein